MLRINAQVMVPLPVFLSVVVRGHTWAFSIWNLLQAVLLFYSFVGHSIFSLFYSSTITHAFFFSFWNLLQWVYLFYSFVGIAFSHFFFFSCRPLRKLLHLCILVFSLIKWIANIWVPRIQLKYWMPVQFKVEVNNM